MQFIPALRAQLLVPLSTNDISQCLIKAPKKTWADNFTHRQRMSRYRQSGLTFKCRMKQCIAQIRIVEDAPSQTAASVKIYPNCMGLLIVFALPLFYLIMAAVFSWLAGELAELNNTSGIAQETFQKSYYFSGFFAFLALLFVFLLRAAQRTMQDHALLYFLRLFPGSSILSDDVIQAKRMSSEMR